MPILVLICIKDLTVIDVIRLSLGLRYGRSEFIDIRFGDDDSGAYGRDWCTPQCKRRLIVERFSVLVDR